MALVLLEALAVILVTLAVVIDHVGGLAPFSAWTHWFLLAGVVSLLLAPLAAVIHLGFRFAKRGSRRCAWYAFGTVMVTLLGIYFAR
ncbi:MAG: hypothetical protein ACE5HT_06175 [Gemmatimonadales bacterium]